MRRLAFMMMVSASPALADMQPIDGFEIDRTEVTVGQYRAFVEAARPELLVDSDTAQEPEETP